MMAKPQLTPDKWSLEFLPDEVDTIIRALRFAARASGSATRGYPNDPAVVFAGSFTRDRCDKLANQITGITDIPSD